MLPETQDDRDPPSSLNEQRIPYLVWQHGIPTPCATPVHASRILLGRDSACDVVLDSERVSRRHVEICCEGPMHVVRDLGSRNGTYVNGRRIDQHALAPGDVLRLGPCIGVVALAPVGTSSWQLQDAGGGLMAGPGLASRLAIARRIARSDLPVTVLGATGTGKERLSRAIHAWSGRQGAFCAVNCAAIPATLAEAELFGYRKGAFTGAIRSQLGHFREANHGTLLLDELADLSLEIQAKLLRAVEEKVIRPLGETTSCPVDVRLLAATQEPLDKLVAAGRFRADLAARLAGLVVELPTLAERRTDIVPLLRYFCDRYLTASVEWEARFVEAALIYEWPKNVRELELLVKRLSLTPGGDRRWELRDLPPAMMIAGPLQCEDESCGRELGSLRDRIVQSRKAGEAERLAVALRSTGGNIKAAAAKLGMTRQRLYRLLKVHGAPRAGTIAEKGPAARGAERRSSPTENPSEFWTGPARDGAGT